MEKMLSVRQLSELLGVARTTIHGWIFKNVMPIPYYKINGRSIRFMEADVKSYVNSIKATKDI